MSDEWDFYFTQVNDAPASVFLDLGIAEEAPKATHPRLIRVRIPFLAPRSDGLSSDEEAPVLAEIEDAIVPALADALDAIYVGRITGEARRELAFYAPEDGNLDLAIRESLAAFPTYELDFAEDQDPDWRHYREFLSPSEREWRWIGDRRLVDQLKEHGDVLAFERAVDHCLLFATEEGREAFIREVEPLGCTVGVRGKSGNEEHPFQIELQRASTVDLFTIHPIVNELADLAEKHGGIYDGWGCNIWKAEDVAAVAQATEPAKKKPAAKKKPSRAKAPPKAKKKPSRAKAPPKAKKKGAAKKKRPAARKKR